MGRAIIFILLVVATIMIIGLMSEAEKKQDLKRYLQSQGNADIPDLGVQPRKDPRHVKHIHIPKGKQKEYLTQEDINEELLQNIEDAEARGMGDDAATREAFKDELR